MALGVFPSFVAVVHTPCEALTIAGTSNAPTVASRRKLSGVTRSVKHVWKGQKL